MIKLMSMIRPYQSAHLPSIASKLMIWRIYTSKESRSTRFITKERIRMCIKSVSFVPVSFTNMHANHKMYRPKSTSQLTRYQLFRGTISIDFFLVLFK